MVEQRAKPAQRMLGWENYYFWFSFTMPRIDAFSLNSSIYLPLPSSTVIKLSIHHTSLQAHILYTMNAFKVVSPVLHAICNLVSSTITFSFSVGLIFSNVSQNGAVHLTTIKRPISTTHPKYLPELVSNPVSSCMQIVAFRKFDLPAAAKDFGVLNYDTITGKHVQG